MKPLSLHLPLADRVYRSILDAICDGEFQPGQRLTQDELARRLEVSRQPVLQALLLLKQQGFVRETGRRGVVVAALEPDFISHLYELRGALDGAACRAAAERGQAEAKLWGPKLIAEGRAAVQSGKLGAMIAADTRFHLFLHRISGNPVIAETAELHWQHVRRVMGGYLGRASAREAIWDEHAAIVEAVAQGDAAEAERLARAHVEAALANLLRSMTQTAAAQGEPKETLERRNAR